MSAICDEIEWEGEIEAKPSLFTDLGPFLNGTTQQEVPSVAEAFDGKHIFYAGRLNEIHAEPATGKTNVLLAATIATIESGESVCYIDPEDTPRGFTARLLALGAAPDDIRERVKYLHNPTPEEIQSAQSWAVENKPKMVVLDGLAESMAAVGSDENKAADVLGFFRVNLRPFAEAGAAVVIADHVTKSAEGRGQFARGSGAKAGRYDGVSYEIVMGKAYTPSVEGFVKLKVQKDRNGGVGPRGMIYAELHFSPGVNGKTITAFREPAEKQDGPFKPTHYMDKIIKHLGIHGEATASALRSPEMGVGGRTEYINQAITCLKEDGVVGVRKEGRAVVHFLLNKDEAA